MTDLEARIQDICLQASDVIEIKDKVFLVNNKIIVEFVGMFYHLTCFCHYVGNDDNLVKVSETYDFCKKTIEILRKRDKITLHTRKKLDIRDLLGVVE